MHTLERGTCQIETYASGLLGRWGHDLQLSLDDFEVRLEPDGNVEATFWPASIRVDGALVDGEIDPSELSDSNRDEIRGNIRQDVLETDQHETIEFQGAWEPVPGGDAFDVQGELELVGTVEPLTTRVVREDGQCRADIGLTQSKWGIEPYSAMMGALKVEDRVQIHFEIPDISEDLG